MAIIVFQHDPVAAIGRLGVTLRDHGFKLDIRRLDLGMEKGGGIPPDFDNVEGVISLGGAANVTDLPPPAWMGPEMAYLRAAHERQLPVIGICLGAQMVATALGGKVGPAAEDKREWGFHRVHVQVPGQTETMLAGISWDSWQFQSHNQEITELPAGPGGSTLLASSQCCRVQAFKVGLRTYGFQYHFECDQPMIRELMKAAPGGMSADLDRQLEAYYPEFARLADRLCVNLAAYAFPLQRRLAG